jgi:two-component system CheB/CheR fusion protein
MDQGKPPFPARSDMGPWAETSSEPANATQYVPITVGIGASAGGHEALERLFSDIPCTCDLAFVVVMHLPADTPSFLADLIRRTTTINVLIVDEGMPLQPNTIYIPPPGSSWWPETTTVGRRGARERRVASSTMPSTERLSSIPR